MKRIADVHGYSPEMADVTKTFLSTIEDNKKQLMAVIEQIALDQFDRLEQYADEHISEVAATRAERFLERVLSGDNDAAMALFGDKEGYDRVRYGGCDEGKPWASVIHGRIFETSGIRLRRELVEAHADLLRNERIADLESVVEGLRLQNCELQKRLDDMLNIH